MSFTIKIDHNKIKSMLREHTEKGRTKNRGTEKNTKKRVLEKIFKTQKLKVAERYAAKHNLEDHLAFMVEARNDFNKYLDSIV